MKAKTVTSGLIATAVLISGLALAGPGRDGANCGHNKRGEYSMFKEGRQDRMLERMTEKLDLTDDQQLSVRAIMDEFQPRKQALRDTMKENRQALREAQHSDSPDLNTIRNLAEQKGQYVTEKTLLRAEVKTRMDAVLTAEQRTKMQEMHEKRRSRFDR